MKQFALLALLAACALLVACEQKKKSPRPPTPTGIIKGHVTATINGPGRAHAPSESFSRTTGIECTVVAIDTSGNTFDAKTSPDATPANGTRAPADGGYEVRVPIGHYDVSFADCLGPRSCGVPTPKPVDVVAETAVTVDWDCEMDAK